jgi:hypothetical protein
VTDQTRGVLSSIDAALEGWHGHDGTVSGDAMRWAPERPTAGQDHVPGYTAAHRYFDARGARADLVILDEPGRPPSLPSVNELREVLTGHPVEPRPLVLIKRRFALQVEFSAAMGIDNSYAVQRWQEAVEEAGGRPLGWPIVTVADGWLTADIQRGLVTVSGMALITEELAIRLDAECEG